MVLCIQAVNLLGTGRSPLSRLFKSWLMPTSSSSASFHPAPEMVQCAVGMGYFPASVPGLQGSSSTAVWELDGFFCTALETCSVFFLPERCYVNRKL